MPPMTKQRKIFLWVGAVVSLSTCGYAGLSFVTYVWLNAANPERWPADKAAIWSYSALAIALLFLFIFFYCVAALIKESNRKYREKKL